MNQEKIGKFIAELRKEKGITQEELGKEFNITPQSISKWERGINLPDSLLLPKLSKKLNVSIDELMKGEKNKDNNKTLKDEQGIINGLQLYENRAKKKCLKKSLIIFTILVTLISLILVMYFINNYNQIKIFSIYSNNSNLSLNGKIIFNPKNKIIMLNNLEYNDNYTGTNKEIKVKALLLKIEANGKNIYTIGSLDIQEESNLFDINSFLKDAIINMSYDTDNENSINVKDLSSTYLVLNYIDSKLKVQELKFKLIADEEFSNHSLFYN